MKALLLAAGRGTRVKPLTDTLPKPMIPIIHKPVMELLIEHLHRFDINSIMVNTSYLSTQIEQYFRDGQRFGVEMAYSFEGQMENGVLLDQPLGSAGAIRKIHQHAGFFDETFVVLCGDAVIDLDFDELIRFHRSHGGLATIALREVAQHEVCNYGVVVQDASGKIIEFQEKPAIEAAKSRTINTGIYIFEPEVLDFIPQHGVYDIGSQLFPILARENQLYGHTSVHHWQWLDIGRLPDFYDVSMKALRGEIKGFQPVGREIAPGVWVGLNTKINLQRCNIQAPVFIGGNVSIADGVELIGPVAIGANSVIDAGVCLHETVVLEHTHVRENIHSQGKIFGPNFCACCDGTVLDSNHTDTSWMFHDSRWLNAPNMTQQMLLKEIQDVLLS